MNKIVIIGNGFDKAHGLLTGYADFIEHLKDSIAYYKSEGDRHKLIR
ncbi:AbiH family protein [uncultured Cyclobacterium sp.]|tara:strand:+ start:100489 stop:100629 length:141 start_codon:yes stop_codon:yes gene_type:complete